MIRILLGIVTLGLIVTAHVHALGSFEYGLWMFAALLTAGLAYGGLFAFFLISGLLAFANSDVHSDSWFSSVFLPYYSGFSIMSLLAILVLMYPKLLGRQIKRTEAGGFWIGGL